MQTSDPRVVWECPWWKVIERRYTGGDGNEHVWYSAHRPNPHTVHILGITPEGHVPILRQWRAPLLDYVWELPAGVCDVDGEEMAETARRELSEEAGFLADEMHHLFTGTVSPGITDELYNAYLALGLSEVSSGGGVGGEQIEVELIPFKQLLGFLLARQATGELVDSKIITHITLALGKLADLELVPGSSHP